ncbi:MAG TPA: hypothetical protein VI321_08565 [Burkholderiales bacterium]
MSNGIAARLAASVIAWIFAAAIFTSASFQARADERLSLPGWLWVSEPWSCPPATASGPAGEMIVTSNVLPTLWRIDPRTLAVSVHPLALDADTDRDVGFSALVYSAQQGSYFAVSSTRASLWRIDRELTRAHKVASLPRAELACTDLYLTITRRLVAAH